MQPEYLHLQQTVLPHQPEAPSWVLQALAPGQCLVTYVEVYGDRERAEMRYEVSVQP